MIIVGSESQKNQGIKIPYKTVGRSGMYIVKAEANQVEKIVDFK